MDKLASEFDTRLADIVVRQIRVKQTPDSTLSELYIKEGDEMVLNGYILEDGYRKTKEYGRTRIPAGLYEFELRREGSHHIKYKKKAETTWKTKYDLPDGWHMGMIHFLNVRGFKYILYHIGNWVKDTLGCTLCGMTYSKDNDGNFAVHRSTDTYIKTYPKIRDHKLLAGENGKVYWHITERFNV